MATYQSAYTGADIDKAVGTIKTGTTNPTPLTIGALGQIYRNTATGALFRCIGIDGTVYTWSVLGTFTISITQPNDGIWLEEVV